MDEQRDVVDMGGTMRLGVYPAKLAPGIDRAAAYGEEVVYERHRHRYEVNNRYRAPARGGGPRVLGHVARRPARRVRRAARRTRSSSPRRRTRSSRAGPTGRTRCSRRSCAPRATGPKGASPRLPIDRRPERRRDGRAAGPAAPVDDRRSEVVGVDAPLVRRRVPRRSTSRRVVGADGDEFDRHVVRHPGAVVVVPVDADGDACSSCASTAPPSGRELLEVPAGKRDVDGEPPEATAARELEEELGQRAGAARAALRVLQLARLLRRVHATCSSPPTSRRATRAAVERRGAGDDDRAVALGDVDDLIAAGELVDAKSIIGLLLARATWPASPATGRR